METDQWGNTSGFYIRKIYEVSQSIILTTLGKYGLFHFLLMSSVILLELRYFSGMSVFHLFC